MGGQLLEGGGCLTPEERNLLVKLASGVLDGMVGDELVYREYKNVFCGKLIKDGEPISYRQYESDRCLNGNNNERIPGKCEVVHYNTDDKKLEFFQKYGWLIDDQDARAYSAKYKRKK